MITESTRAALGQRLEHLRRRAEMSRAVAAGLIDVAPSELARIEDGMSAGVCDLHVNTLCDAYMVTLPERRAVLALALDVRSADMATAGRAFATPSV